jgi:hypothetical protein
MTNSLPDRFTETILASWTKNIPEGDSKVNYIEFMLLVLKSPQIDYNEDLRLIQLRYELAVNDYLSEH